jgi:hypothetical protein
LEKYLLFYLGVSKENSLWENAKILNVKSGGKGKGALTSGQNPAPATLPLRKNHNTH